MANKFSQSSADKLASCDPDLQRLFNEVIKHIDCTVIEGHRNQQVQDEYFRTGKSKLRYPFSKHNRYPSRAVDVMAYPIDWDDWDSHYYFAGFVKGVAAAMGIKIRSGLDWDDDNDLSDQTFLDAPHFELI